MWKWRIFIFNVTFPRGEIIQRHLIHFTLRTCPCSLPLPSLFPTMYLWIVLTIVVYTLISFKLATLFVIFPVRCVTIFCMYRTFGICEGCSIRYNQICAFRITIECNYMLCNPVHNKWTSHCSILFFVYLNNLIWALYSMCR